MSLTAAQELAKYLQAQGVATLGGNTQWGLYTTEEPANPDSVVTIYDTQGGAPVLYDEKLLEPTIQIRVRHYDYMTAVEKINEIFDILNQVKDTTIEDHYYIGVWATSTLFPLGKDENNRWRLTHNYRIQRSEVS